MNRIVDSASTRLDAKIGLDAAIRLALLALIFGTAHAAAPLRQIQVDAATPQGLIRSLQGVDGLPVGADAAGWGIRDAPDLRQRWAEAHVDAVRTYIWHARLDTVDNPAGLFPRWTADPSLPSSYNFKAADDAIRAARGIGAVILFTVTSSIPRNTRPPADLAQYAEVVRHIAQHYTQGWADGFSHAVRYWEIGDEPDLNKFHFSGTPEQFYAIYDAAARAIKAVDASLQVGGPGLAFPLNENSPFREGFLRAVKTAAMPFDFFSWKWYSDATEDPFDIPRVAKVTTVQLATHGLAGTPQFLTDWNFNGIPTARPDPLQMGAYESAVLTYLQDTPIARAFMFRGDAGMGSTQDPDPDLTTRMFDQDGTPRKSAFAFAAVGRMQDTPQRLPARGGDENGFAVLAGRNAARNTVQVLITNYAIPAAYLVPTDKTSLDFDLPIAATRVPVSMQLPPRRTNAGQKNNGGYDLHINGLPWKGARYQVQRYRLDATHDLSLVDTTAGRGKTVHVTAALEAPGIELIVVREQP